ncbi:hypothetical protein ACFY3V_32125 [Streptosporangium sp. NPDC000095]|uniref:hypothetical protein n=1 Tax=Streptosporangium sp. NPDC000095 TaxID=3366184 RepID=UPI00368F4FF2
MSEKMFSEEQLEQLRSFPEISMGPAPILPKSRYGPADSRCVPIERHSDFNAWRTALSAEEWPNGIRRDGCLHLHASVADYEEITIVIFADIYDDER